MNLCESFDLPKVLFHLFMRFRYEMYAGDRPLSSMNVDSQGAATSLLSPKDGLPESGPALELIEMANGETIW